MRTTRPHDEHEAGRVVEPTIPDQHQGWGGDGYADGEPVPMADAPGWGANGFAGTEPGRQAEAELTGDLPTPDRSPDAAVGAADPAGDDDPGPHPASVLAGR
jgi:hypothetical protein